MGSNERFYMLEMRSRPVLHGDISSLLKVDGLIVGGGGVTAGLMLPSATGIPDKFFTLSDEEWVDFIQRSDQPEILMGNPKVFQRKARFEVSGIVQQKVWVADKLSCMYCFKTMGKVQLTIDHFIPLELGGVNDTSNYLTACRRCNKDKGCEDPRKYCTRKGLDYDKFINYLKVRIV